MPPPTSPGWTASSPSRGRTRLPKKATRARHELRRPAPHDIDIAALPVGPGGLAPAPAGAGVPDLVALHRQRRGPVGDVGLPHPAGIDTTAGPLPGGGGRRGEAIRPAAGHVPVSRTPGHPRHRPQTAG